MSYNLLVEGDLDLFALSRSPPDLRAIEMFPIDATSLGIALPSSRVNDDARIEITNVVREMLSIEATVYDLFTGQPIKTAEDLDALLERIFG